MPRLEYMYPGGENFIARDDAGELWLYYRYVDRGPLKFPDNQLDWIDGQVGFIPIGEEYDTWDEVKAAAERHVPRVEITLGNPLLSGYAVRAAPRVLQRWMDVDIEKRRQVREVGEKLLALREVQAQADIARAIRDILERVPVEGYEDWVNGK